MQRDNNVIDGYIFHIYKFIFVLQILQIYDTSRNNWSELVTKTFLDVLFQSQVHKARFLALLVSGEKFEGYILVGDMSPQSSLIDRTS